MRKELINRINTMEVGYWRRYCGVTLLDKIPNEEILRSMGVERTLCNNIEGNQLTWYGHLMQMVENRLPKQMYQWIPN